MKIKDKIEEAMDAGGKKAFLTIWVLVVLSLGISGVGGLLILAIALTIAQASPELFALLLFLAMCAGLAGLIYNDIC